MVRHQCIKRVTTAASVTARRILATHREYVQPGRRAGLTYEDRAENEKAFKESNPDAWFILPEGALYIRQRYEEARYMCDYRIYAALDWKPITNYILILKRIANENN